MRLARARRSMEDDDLGPSADEILVRMRAGVIGDYDFDRVFLPDHQSMSGRYWTPVRAALQAVRWLTGTGATRILDVGAGVGKLCLVGGIMTAAEFHGIEQRSALVAAARVAADRARLVKRVAFHHGTLDSVDWARFDGVYLYNPFGENLHAASDTLDETVELSEERYKRDVVAFEGVLRGLGAGTRVVTYHGFGGCFPNEFELKATHWIGGGRLNLWIKTPSMT